MLNNIRKVKFIKMRKLTMFITDVCVLLLIKRKVADELREIWTTNIKFLLLFAYWQLQIFPKYCISGRS